MKKIISFFLMLFVVCLTQLSFADDYTVTVTTYDVTGSTVNFSLGAYPNIADGARIDKIVLSQTGEVNQTISIYDTATSTSAASLAYTVVMMSTATAPTASIIQIDFPGHNPLKLRDMAIRKSSTGSTVYGNIQYR